MSTVSTDVSVIGTGAMGTAIAAALLGQELSVTVWNRSPERARPLGKRGAEIASSLPEAIAASPCSIVALLDYALSDRLLQVPGVESELGGRTVLQLTSGAPADAVGDSIWAAAHGASYLDGYPMCFDAEIATPTAVVVWSGAQIVFERWHSLLQGIGRPIHLGEQVELANAALIGSVPLYQGAILGFLQGTAVAETYGLAPATFRDVMSQFLPALGTMVAETGDRLSGAKSPTDPHTRISNQLPVARSLVDAAATAGVSRAFPDHLVTWFERAVDGGMERQDVAAMIGLFRDGEAAR